jgi:hypothetical protein
MSRLCCRPCRVRFAQVVHLTTCPQCGAPAEAVDDRESLVGLRLFGPGDVLDMLPEALSVSLPDPTGAWT